MDKKEYKEVIIDKILANSSAHCWSGDDRPWLMEQPENFLLNQIGLNADSSAEKAFKAAHCAKCASREAIKEGTPEAHQAAFDEHEKAQKAHEEVGNEYAADDHARQAAQHKKMGDVLTKNPQAPTGMPY